MDGLKVHKSRKGKKGTRSDFVNMGEGNLR